MTGTKRSYRRRTGFPTPTSWSSRAECRWSWRTDAEVGFKMSPEQLEAAITPPHASAHPQQPLQPDRGLLRASRARGTRRSASPLPGGGRRDRRHVREDHVGRRAVREPADGGSGSRRPHRGAQRRVEGLRDDRMAHRLRGRATRYQRRHAQDPVTVHLEPLLRLAGGRGGGNLRRPRLRRGAEPDLPRAPRLREPTAQRAARRELCRGQGGVLRVPRTFARQSRRTTMPTTTSSTPNGSSRWHGSQSSRAPPSALPASCASPSPPAWRTSRRPSTGLGTQWARARRNWTTRDETVHPGIDRGRTGPLRFHIVPR